MKLNDRIDQQTKDDHTGYENADIYDLVNEIYSRDKQGQEVNAMNEFINDYVSYINNMDKDKIYKKFQNDCDFASCKSLTRTYRDKAIYDANKQKRYDLYFKSKTEKSILMQQMIDILHVIQHHIIQLGYRIDIDCNDDEKTDNDRGLFSRIRQEIIAKREGIQNIRSDINRSIINTKSKFVTIINDVDDDKRNGGDHEYPQYSQSIRFFYHKYYKNNHTEKEKIPGTDILENHNFSMNPNYTFASWYIEPKHGSMKEEILNPSNRDSINIIQYQSVLTKAVHQYKAIGHTIHGAIPGWQIVYNLPTGSKISLQHIFAVMVYTDFTNLSAAFSATYRKLTTTESDRKWKSRHREYAHFARLLREAVECWGTFIEDVPHLTKFYHGISRRMVFKHFMARFCGPTSCSLRLDIATTFASQGQNGDGIVITFKNNRMAVPFFWCKNWSNFPWEEELLFLGGLEPMQICALCTISDGQEYNHWIRSMRRFQQSMIIGHALQQKVSQSNASDMSLLCSYILNDDNNDKRCKIPQYVKLLWKNILKETKVVTINTGIIYKNKHSENDVAYKTDRNWYGCSAFNSIYLNDKKQIDFQRLQKLYPSLLKIAIRKRKIIYNKANCETSMVYVPSISITSSLISSILSYIAKVHHTAFIAVMIISPSNSINELYSFSSKYSSSFEKLDFNLCIIKKPDVKSGDRISFYIARRKTDIENLVYWG